MYLVNLQTTLVAWIVHRVDVILERRRSLMTSGGDDEGRKLSDELLSHLDYYRRLEGTKLGGCDEVENRLNALIKDDLTQGHQLLLLHGPEGTGKTALLVRWMGRLRAVFGEESVLVLRFVGLTPSSSSPDELLRSICMQLNVILKRSDDIKVLNEKGVVVYFFDLLDEMAQMPQKFFFVVDGVEKLRAPLQGSEVHFWEGIAAILPQNVHFLVSFTTCSTNLHLFHRLTNQVSHEKHLVAMPELPIEQLRALVSSSLEQNQRKLTPEQLEVILGAIKPRVTPLYVELLIQEALCWSCHEQLNGTAGPSCTLEEAVALRFDTLEKRYGEELIASIARYLSSANYGLTEMELLDMLSCNNDILLLTYPKDLPTLLRFPHTVWQRIRNDMGKLYRRASVGPLTGGHDFTCRI